MQLAVTFKMVSDLWYSSLSFFKSLLLDFDAIMFWELLAYRIAMCPTLDQTIVISRKKFI